MNWVQEKHGSKDYGWRSERFYVSKSWNGWWWLSEFDGERWHNDFSQVFHSEEEAKAYAEKEIAA